MLGAIEKLVQPLLGVVSGMALFACSAPFGAECQETRSCAAPAGGSAGVAGEEAGGSAGGPDEGGGGGGSQLPAACALDAECDDGEPASGNETCVEHVCRAGNPPPRVVSVTPTDGADGVELDSVVTLTFSEPLAADSVSTEALRVLDEGDVELEGTVELSAAEDELTFRPREPLALWASYRIELDDTIQDRDGAALLEPFSASFQARDAAWSVTDLASGPSVKLPRSLPASTDGSVLATWLIEADGQCAAAGSWVLRGRTQPAWLFKTPAQDGACTDLSASVAPDGDAAVSWIRGEQDYSQSFMQGAWASSERMNRARTDAGAAATSVLAHAASR